MHVEDSQDNLKKCICMNCPSHNECMKGNMEGLFCARDKSTCDFNQQGCICGECPITTDNQLSSSYYCDSGDAGEAETGTEAEAE